MAIMKIILTFLLFISAIGFIYSAEVVYSCGDPISHDNLTIYPVYSKQHSDTSRFITLQEAMELHKTLGMFLSEL